MHINSLNSSFSSPARPCPQEANHLKQVTPQFSSSKNLLGYLECFVEYSHTSWKGYLLGLVSALGASVTGTALLTNALLLKQRDPNPLVQPLNTPLLDKQVKQFPKEPEVNQLLHQRTEKRRELNLSEQILSYRDFKAKGLELYSPYQLIEKKEKGQVNVYLLERETGKGQKLIDFDPGETEVLFIPDEENTFIPFVYTRGSNQRYPALIDLDTGEHRIIEKKYPPPYFSPTYTT